MPKDFENFLKELKRKTIEAEQKGEDAQKTGDNKESQQKDGGKGGKQQGTPPGFSGLFYSSFVCVSLT
jgi:hypothetical protein